MGAKETADTGHFLKRFKQPMESLPFFHLQYC